MCVCRAYVCIFVYFVNDFQQRQKRLRIQHVRSLFPSGFIGFVFVVFKTLNVFNILHNTYEGGAILTTWNDMLGKNRMNVIDYRWSEVV